MKDIKYVIDYYCMKYDSFNIGKRIVDALSMSINGYPWYILVYHDIMYEYECLLSSSIWSKTK